MILMSILAALLQALGYVMYIRFSLKSELKPNGATWFMFAYGVFILTLLEWDKGANLALLLLPTVCAVLAVVVARICWRQGTMVWPTDWEDRAAFIADLSLTAVYLVVAFLAFKGDITEHSKAVALNLFLIISNATAFTSFTPLIRGVKKDPTVEHPLPWTIWGGAYLLLGFATLLEEGGVTIFMIYPVVNFVLHIQVALLACRHRT